MLHQQLSSFVGSRLIERETKQLILPSLLTIVRMDVLQMEQGKPLTKSTETIDDIEQAGVKEAPLGPD